MQTSGTFPGLNAPRMKRGGLTPGQRAKLAIQRRDGKAATAASTGRAPVPRVPGGLRAHREMARKLARGGRA